MAEISGSTQKWYALYTKPRFEKKVYDLLVKKNIHTFLPLRKRLKQWKNRKAWVNEVLFNSYIFVFISENEFLNALKTDGIVRFVSFEKKPVPIPESQIETVKKIIATNIVFDISFDKLQIGDLVEVTDGALIGIRGNLVNFKGNKKVAVTFDILNQSILLEIDPKLLKRIK